MYKRILALISALVGPAMAQEPTLTVHCDRPGHAISPRLWGVFFEEINHAGDGGLYAELIRNRGFEEPSGDGNVIPGWSLEVGAGSEASMSLDRDLPAAPGAGAALRVAVNSGQALVVSRGYWGVAARAGARYRLRLDARRDARMADGLIVAWRAADGRELASTHLTGLTSAGKRFDVEMMPTADDVGASLVLTFEGPGTAWLDCVSLVPVETWRKHRFGLRNDLGTLVEGLRPSFVRFPGGCFVEGGDSLKDAFRWPRTLGDPASRPGHMNANWGYWSSDGLGFHEYLQWCEDLGAEPLLVVNCGMSHKESVPIDQLGEWVQEALDAIEYANGPSTSRWGRVRAENGHPASFGLKYIEIGNENGMFGGFGGSRAEYTERYRIFHEAIKARAPEITTIANVRVDAPMDVADDHFYNSPAWFWSNVHLYDKADRSGPRIYVGEYAVTQGAGTGNLAAALGEAAFMTGLERNSDLVVMASYAPMFVHSRDRKWSPDMIVFDGLRSYGTPSYWVQRMFAEHRVQTLLAADVPVIEKSTVTGGGIGLGCWKTEAEFKDVVVERDGKVLYQSAFAAGAAGWNAIAGTWAAVDGLYRQSGRGENHVAMLDCADLRNTSDYAVSLKARKIAGEEGFLVMFRAADQQNWCWWNIGGWGNRTHAVEKSVDGMKFGVGAGVAGSVESGRWYDVRIELAGKSIRCFLDGALIQTVEDRSVASLAAVAGKMDDTGEIIVKVVNGDGAAATMTVALDGAGPVMSEGRVMVLSSAMLGDENSFENPRHIVPRSANIVGVSERFSHEFPARSVTMMRLFPRR